jgi:hypothetical protein
VLDTGPWGKQLCARATESGASDDRIHGYALLGDLAKHYHYSDLVYLALLGELPDDVSSRLFRLALYAFASVSVGEACCHAAVLSRVTAAPPVSAIGVGIVAAAGEVRSLIERHASLLMWLDDGAHGTSPFHGEPNEWVVTLCEAVKAIDPGARLPQPEMTREAACITLLVVAGVRDPERISAAILAAKLCGLMAETLATGPGDFSAYPVQVPAFHYVEDPDS